MSKTLLIIESPGKKKTLQAILGDDYRIEASYGHIRDLPLNDMGVEAPAFKPTYVVDDDRAKDTVKRLKAAAAAADRVLLATDPDREGEAIAWHVAQVLKIANPLRVTYQEITPAAVTAAVAKPRELNYDLVQAQEARRVLDRFVGYMVSPLLAPTAASSRLSAGRVQSPAVRLVVDRERAIRQFVETKHFGVVAHVDGAAAWRAELLMDSIKVASPASFQNDYLLDRNVAETCTRAATLIVQSIDDSQSRTAPSAPFTTSTLQQQAQRTLKFKPKQTMELAQALYEQGVITYMRTDSPNLADDACAEIETIARSRGWPLPEKRRRFKTKASAQEAHEAIRPSHFENESAGDSTEQKLLYKLIWERAVASQLADAVFDVRTAMLSANVDLDGKPVGIVFRAKGRTLADAGWKSLSKVDDDEATESSDEESSNPVPRLEKGGVVTPSRYDVVAKATKPPKRFTEATLIGELENRGIGRPSTYASILTNISTRGYIAEDKKGWLASTEVGEKSIVDALVGRCQFIELDYTRKLEAELDDIAEGKKKYVDVVSEAFSTLEREIAVITKSRPSFDCPECKKPLRQRSGKSGLFWGCTGYPKCKTTFPDVSGKPDFEAKKEGALTKSGDSNADANQGSQANAAKYKCPDCKNGLRRQTRNKQDDPKGKGWDFFGCTGYPNCKKTFKVNDQGEPIFAQK